MLTGSFGVSIAPRGEGRVFTGPMTLAGLVLAAGAVVRLTGLDGAGWAFCYFKALTGYACFTCGTTRAIGHLARLDLASAFAVQPLLTVGVLGLLSWGALDAALFVVSRRTIARVGGQAYRVAFITGLVLATLNWIYLLATGV